MPDSLDAVVVQYTRSPFGRAEKGALLHERSDDLGGAVVGELLSRLPQLDPREIVDLYWGCSLPHRSQGYNIARQVGLLGGLPATVPGVTLSRSCGSAMSGIRAAVHALQAGDGDVYVAGGSDSLSTCLGWTTSESDENPRFLDPDRSDYSGAAYVSVFDTGENVADQYGVTRDEMDAYTVRSQQLASNARDSGYLGAEITKVETSFGGLIGQDDCLRPGTTTEVLAGLRPIVAELGGRITAGNTCVAADGAAAVVLMSAKRARELEVTPLARVVASAVSGCEPELMGIGPVEATRSALKKAGLTINDLDAIECHENFAAQVLAVAGVLGIDIDRQLNLFGGALAIGHPPGATGARLVGTLTHALAETDGSLGLATTCVAGGMGVAMVLERV
jgi:acetyl-CoA C-acetyltransferase